ncbi:MAG: YitT family protein [Clostridia bacterium]|nr:YitT family protein [Clostridia bacterium]
MNLDKKLKKELHASITMLLAAMFSFVSLYVLVLPAGFAPSGVDGISTLLYEITGINIGWFKLLINIPLMILALIYLKKRYVLYVIIFTLVDSFGVIILEQLNFYTFIPSNLDNAQAIGYRLIAAIFAGIAMGLSTSFMLKIGCSTGGVDIIGCLVNLKKPNLNIERVVSIICYSVVICSYFVYHDLTSVLLSVIQIFIYECTVYIVLKKDRYALEVKIVTKNPEIIRDEIIYKHHHSATIIDAKGMYTNENYYMVITVLNSRDIAEFMKTMKKYPETFIYISDGVRVQGNFHFGYGNKKGEHISAY